MGLVLITQILVVLIVVMNIHKHLDMFEHQSYNIDWHIDIFCIVNTTGVDLHNDRNIIMILHSYPTMLYSQSLTRWYINTILYYKLSFEQTTRHIAKTVQGWKIITKPCIVILLFSNYNELLLIHSPPALFCFHRNNFQFHHAVHNIEKSIVSLVDIIMSLTSQKHAIIVHMCSYYNAYFVIILRLINIHCFNKYSVIMMIEYYYSVQYSYNWIMKTNQNVKATIHYMYEIDLIFLNVP